MALDINSILTDMLNAAKTSLGDSWKDVKDVATASFKNLAQTLAEIEQMRLAGTITSEKAILMLDMQKQAVIIAIATEEALGLVAAQNALNAALDVIKKVVNTTIGFVLL
ncbi:MAG: hypothetical protein JO072_03595 [Parafilimonas sp.]|nr:hypothetical protein [Parafilimonas sp.]